MSPVLETVGRIRMELDELFAGLQREAFDSEKDMSCMGEVMIHIDEMERSLAKMIKVMEGGKVC